MNIQEYNTLFNEKVVGSLSEVNDDINVSENTVTNKANLDLSNVINSVFLNKGLSVGLGQVELKSYKGSGKYGADNPNSLTFSFTPKLVIWLGSVVGNIWQDSGYRYDKDNRYDACTVVIVDKLTTNYVANRGFWNFSSSYSYGKKSSDGKTISFYHTQDVQRGLSESNCTYYFLAIG